MYTAIGEQYIIDERGKATAVILPIESYKRLIEIIHDLDDKKENEFLSRSLEFKNLVEKGMDDIHANMVTSWRDVWNEA